jgi:hypothetical protein
MLAAGQNCTFSLTVAFEASTISKTVFDATPNAKFGLRKCSEWQERWPEFMAPRQLWQERPEFMDPRQQWAEIAGPCAGFTGSYERYCPSTDPTCSGPGAASVGPIKGSVGFNSLVFEPSFDVEYTMRECKDRCESNPDCTAIAFGEEFGCSLHLDDLCIPSYDGGNRLDIGYLAHGCIENVERLECTDLSKPRAVVPVTPSGVIAAIFTELML